MPLNRRQILRLTPAALALSAVGATARPTLAVQPSKPRIKIGQIGVGHGHATKLSVYRDSPDYEVVGIVEPNEHQRRQAEKNPAFKGLSWLTEEQLLNTPGLQAVLIETHVRDLLDNAETCVKAGKHVHIDKPAGESLSQLGRIFETGSQHNLLVQMGYMYRYNPAIKLLHQFLSQGWLGDVFEIHGVMSKVVDPQSRRELAAYQGGMMFELGCHILDLIVGIMGKPQKVSAYHRMSGAHGDGLLDNTLAVLEYPRAVATVKSSALEVEGFLRRHLVVCGTEGTFHIQPLDNPVAQVSLGRDCGEFRKGSQVIPLPIYTRYLDDAADMAMIIREEKESDFQPEHDLAVQESLLMACGRNVV